MNEGLRQPARKAIVANIRWAARCGLSAYALSCLDYPEPLMGETQLRNPQTLPLYKAHELSLARMSMQGLAPNKPQGAG